jgi:L-ascorbate metabolism protein UlaG (beta-lactamase superfamily)
MPLVGADYVLVTHDHFDHRAVHRSPEASVVRERCDLAERDLNVVGVADQHVPGHGPPGMPNVIFLVEAGGVRCCHWGDNRARPPRRVIERLGRVDVLMVPVDDTCHLLQYEDVDTIVETLHPRVVVPMHYFHPNVSDDRSALRGIAEWLARQTGVPRTMEGRIELRPERLPTERQTWILEPFKGGN